MGWGLLDNAMIDAVAQRSGLTPSEVAEREERLPSLVERLGDALTMSTPDLVSPPLTSPDLPPSETRLLEITRHVIEDAAERGPVVIVGRGADEMLGSRHDLLSVFCYAPHRALVARTMAREHLDEAAATKRVDEVNKRRAEWARVHWNREWRAPEHYHLCINTDAFGTHGTAHVIVDVARRMFGNF
jgi:cytidylate kinase